MSFSVKTNHKMNNIRITSCSKKMSNTVTNNTVFQDSCMVTTYVSLCLHLKRRNFMFHLLLCSQSL